jgi:hypothetical protein
MIREISSNCYVLKQEQTSRVKVSFRNLFLQMFTHELVTNPWMYYKFKMVSPEAYNALRHVWMGKSFVYHTNAVLFPGWYGALSQSEYACSELYKIQVADFKRTMGMGTHPRLGEASLFMKFAGVPEIFGLISLQF